LQSRVTGRELWPPERIDEVAAPSVKMMLALRTMRILAAMMPSTVCGSLSRRM
jgi:hypothetical protein